MKTYNPLVEEEKQALADLLNKWSNIGLTDEEQALLDELRTKERSQFPAEQIETMREAARQMAKLVKCGLTLAQLAFHREILDRFDKNDTSIAPEEMREFEEVCRRIERCLRGGGDPPGGPSGPNDSGPSITDALGVQLVEDDGDDEAKPTLALPVEEPEAVQVTIPVKDEDEKKKKPQPRTRVPVKRGGVDFP